MEKIVWKLQENIIDKKNINVLINFLKKTDRYTQFTQVRKFEEAWSKWQGCKYSVFVNSGSSANLIILDTLKDIYAWLPGDEIIVPAITWITDISSILQLGLKPVFVDINLDDFSFDYTNLANKITSKTKAIFLTHLMGFPGNINKINIIINDKNKKIVLIEDCCESHGARLNSQKVGNMGICSSFSFYWGHHMTTVEGGMVCTNNEDIYKYILLKRSHGLARELPIKFHDYYKKKYPNIDFNFLFLTTGFNVRNTELSAVLGLEQLKKLNDYIKIRNNNYNKFINILKKFDDNFYIFNKNGISSFCLPIIMKNKELKNKLQAYLTQMNIESRPIISGNLLKQPFLRKINNVSNFPNANIIHNNGFYIGNNQFVNTARLNYLKKLLVNFFKN